MALNIRSLMGQSVEYPLDSQHESEWLSKFEKSGKEEKWLIIPEGYLSKGKWNQQIRRLKEAYKIDAMFQLKDIYIQTSISMLLIHFTNKPVSYVKFSLWHKKNKSLHKEKIDKQSTLSVGKSFSDDYIDYLRSIEAWINYPPKTPNNTQYSEFALISINEIDEEHFYPQFYSRESRLIRDKLKNSQTIRLSEIADIVSPEILIKSTSKKVLHNYSYPLDDSCFVERDDNKGIELQNGDIIIPHFKHKLECYLFQCDKQGCFASENSYVIRLKSTVRDISPDYLFLYLQSDAAKTIFDCVRSTSIISRLSEKDLESFPIIKPSMPLESYAQMAHPITSFGVTPEVYDLIEHDIETANNVEDILNIELVKNAKVYNKELLKEFFEKDVRELNICYKHKAYKAAIILAGSILEAFLIDWLSEKKHKNLFDENDNGEYEKTTLFKLIEAIGNLTVPKWMEQEKADHIRNARNNVHAKVCIKNDEINEKTCKEVIDYLIEILKTRGY